LGRAAFTSTKQRGFTMGLFSRLTGKKVESKPTDDILLFHAMICMCAADGVLEQSEMSSVEAFYDALPEFRGKDFKGLLDNTNKLFAKHGVVKESVKALAEIESDAVRTKAFILAVDIALASGDVDESEDQMLDAMQRVLNVQDHLAKKVVEVLSLKYAT
jgi:tellurite resistance protein